VGEFIVFDAEDRLEDPVGDDDTCDKPKRDMYDIEERAGRFSARAALWSKGEVVEEKL
jgi:hypothetical protein